MYTDRPHHAVLSVGITDPKAIFKIAEPAIFHSLVRVATHWAKRMTTAGRSNELAAVGLRARDHDAVRASVIGTRVTTEAIVLDFMQPQVAGGQCLGFGREARRDEA